MKPCQKYRERAALLAAHALENEEEADLRAHLRVCAGCRRYVEEIAGVAGKVRAAEPAEDGQPSAQFHGRVIRALERASAQRRLQSRVDFLRNWRWAFGLATAFGLVLAAWLVTAPRPQVIATVPIAAPSPNVNLQPTLSNYEMAIHDSFDKFDDLLTSQGIKDLSPSPAYLAARSLRLNAAD